MKHENLNAEDVERAMHAEWTATGCCEDCWPDVMADPEHEVRRGVTAAVAAYLTKPLPDDLSQVSALDFGGQGVWLRGSSGWTDYRNRWCVDAETVIRWTMAEVPLIQWRDLDGQWWHTPEADQCAYCEGRTRVLDTNCPVCTEADQ